MAQESKLELELDRPEADVAEKVMISARNLTKLHQKRVSQLENIATLAVCEKAKTMKNPIISAIRALRGPGDIMAQYQAALKENDDNVVAVSKFNAAVAKICCSRSVAHNPAHYIGPEKNWIAKNGERRVPNDPAGITASFTTMREALDTLLKWETFWPTFEKSQELSKAIEKHEEALKIFSDLKVVLGKLNATKIIAADDCASRLSNAGGASASNSDIDLDEALLQRCEEYLRGRTASFSYEDLPSKLLELEHARSMAARWKKRYTKVCAAAVDDKSLSYAAWCGQLNNYQNHLTAFQQCHPLLFQEVESSRSFPIIKGRVTPAVTAGTQRSSTPAITTASNLDDALILASMATSNATLRHANGTSYGPGLKSSGEKRKRDDADGK